MKYAAYIAMFFGAAAARHHHHHFFRHSDVNTLQTGTEFIGAHESGRADGKYERVVPARFSADSDDLFMRSMISKYALEGQHTDKEHEDEPDGTFWMNEATARAAASEVLATHKGLTGSALASYLDTYFAKTWAHFDVNRTGAIEVIKMP